MLLADFPGLRISPLRHLSTQRAHLPHVPPEHISTPEPIPTPEPHAPPLPTTRNLHTYFGLTTPLLSNSPLDSTAPSRCIIKPEAKVEGGKLLCLRH